MKRQIKNLVLTAASIAVTVGGTVPAQACGGRGGRSYGSVSRGHYPVARQPVYLPPSQPVCAEPRVLQTPPHFPQPIQQVQPAGGLNGQQPVQQVQPAGGRNVRQSVQQLQPAGGLNVRQAAASTPVPVNQANPAAAAPRTVNGQLPSSGTQGQPASSAANPSGGNSQTAEASALQMLVSISTRRATPAQTSVPVRTTSQTATQIPQFSAAAQQPAASHIGTWKANLPANQSVQLTLNADGSFVWTAIRSGKSSTFQGQFRLESGRLTLVRSNDLQQMAGSWSGAENQFTFKLNGATTGGLAFQRS